MFGIHLHLQMSCHIKLAVFFVHLFLYIIDVCSSLFPNVYNIDTFPSIELTATSIVLEPWTCNDMEFEFFDISRFTLLESLDIGSNSFAFVKMFKIKALSRLKSLRIGIRSFTERKGSFGENKSKSFHILNCESLRSIEIGEFSFSDYSGEFELRNCPQLHSLKIGSIKKDSYNFYYSSFVIRGIDMKSAVMNRSSGIEVR